ncbi:hypothetical protein DFH06DRAFT_1128548 [Mycena polygramma]|nr:hypothetical protein DFH06DRAFT_1128548 [Mycena polygramma]
MSQPTPMVVLWPEIQVGSSFQEWVKHCNFSPDCDYASRSAPLERLDCPLPKSLNCLVDVESECDGKSAAVLGGNCGSSWVLLSVPADYARTSCHFSDFSEKVTTAPGLPAKLAWITLEPDSLRLCAVLGIAAARPQMEMSITPQDTKPSTKVESMDVGARPTTDPYAAAARALEQAQLAFTTALATPMLLLKRQLRLERDRTTIAALGKAADEAAKAHKAELEARTNAFRRLLAKDRELLATQRAASVTEREAITTQCAALQAEKQALLEERKSMTLNLQGMIQTMQRQPVPVPVKPTSLVPASGTALTVGPPSSAVSNRGPASSRQVLPPDAPSAIDSIPSRKRQRTESAPTAPPAVGAAASVAGNTKSTDAAPAALNTSPTRLPLSPGSISSRGISTPARQGIDSFSVFRGNVRRPSRRPPQ